MIASSVTASPGSLRGVDFPWSSFVELLRTRAQQQPDQLAYDFLTDSREKLSITYAELDLRARSIAAKLQSLGAPGQRVLLLHPPGLEFVAAFLGCLYAGAVAVTTYAPHPSRIRQALPGLQGVVDDAQCGFVLGTASLLAGLKNLNGSSPVWSISELASDTVPAELAAAWQDPQATPATLAFLQYTSGSTSKPRGVMLTHGNLLHNSGVIGRGFENDTSSRGVMWLPPYHDMGLIGGVLQPLYVGFPCTLMSPLTFLQQPIRWLQAISEARATASGGPNFAYDLCVRKIKPEQRSQLDLSSWRVAFNGAEPIHAETLDAFATAFGPCGFRRESFYPCYGLAEATLFVTGPLHEARPTMRGWETDALAQNKAVPTGAKDERLKTLVSCGRTSPDQKVVIVDPDSRKACSPNRVGEVWVSGPSVAMGYWNRPQENSRTFQAFLADTGEGPFLRTGDLGFLCQGELFITGRLKDIIIVNGRKHYPHDLELSAQSSHSGLRPGCGAAFALEGGGTERVVVLQEIDRQYLNADVNEIVSSIRRAIAEKHGLQPWAVALLKPGTLPKTSSGKIKRYACRNGFLNGSLEIVGGVPSTLEN